MKTQKQIETAYKKYKRMDDPELVKKNHWYEGPTPLTEWAWHQDKGYKKALAWVLGIKDEEE